MEKNSWEQERLLEREAAQRANLISDMSEFASVYKQVIKQCSNIVCDDQVSYSCKSDHTRKIALELPQTTDHKMETSQSNKKLRAMDFS